MPRPPGATSKQSGVLRVITTRLVGVVHACGRMDCPDEPGNDA